MKLFKDLGSVMQQILIDFPNKNRRDGHLGDSVG